jgi:5-methylcytosine-specific restriction enzyme A
MTGAVSSVGTGIRDMMVGRKRLCPCGCSERLGPGQRRCAASLRQKDAARGSRHARGYTNAWADYSRARLARHPVCVHCGAPATVTNHIQGARAHPERFWDPTNHESVCAGCNSRQNIAREGGFGRVTR